MAKSHKKITISIPIELDRVIEALVNESKSTSKPITKSQLITCSVYEYLHNAEQELNSQKKNPKEEC